MIKNRLLIFLLLLTTGILSFTQFSLVRGEDSVRQEMPPVPPRAQYVGSSSCKACHQTVYQNFSTAVHGKALTDDALDAALRGCEACHGPGSVHVGNPARYKPAVPKAADASGVADVCGKCHLSKEGSSAPAEWRQLNVQDYSRSTHTRKGVSCLSCHTGHPNGNDKALRKPGDTLCLDCHASVMETAPGKKAEYTHAPVAQKQCLMCHDPHGASGGKLVVNNLRQVCLQCHDAADATFKAKHLGYIGEQMDCAGCHDAHSHQLNTSLMKSKAHQPFKTGKCETCHTKPEEGAPAGLIKPAKDLCASCHPAKTLMPEGEKSHAPVAAGMCLSCHNPHVAKQKGMLKDRQADLCFACHKKVEKATLAPHRHQILDSTMDCGLCHRPHSAPQDNLMPKSELSLCGQCHKHSFSHPMEKKADGTPVLDPRTKTPLLCHNCHDTHGGEFDKLTTGDSKRDLCIKCHADDH